ncbi:MAG: hypothetical protein ACTSYJ_12635 [Candidatus Thorarchaeota archaeon]
MSGADQFEPRVESLRIAKVILSLSLLLPYIWSYPSSESFYSFMIYAPFWVLAQQGTLLVGGPSPMALIMFQFWLPYVLIGYQATRYANGRCSSESSYLLSIVLLTIVAILFVIPISINPSGFMNGEDIYQIAIPIPIIPILALLSVRQLSPTQIEVPWTEESEPVDAVPDEESVWND